jgi:circadian clock protein KaiB
MALKSDLAVSFERILTRAAGKYRLKLYVSGSTPRSLQAVRNLKSICEEFLGGRYDLSVIDLFQQPGLARGAQISVAPTLVKHTPLPVRRLLGDFSDRSRVLAGLGIKLSNTEDGGR